MAFYFCFAHGKGAVNWDLSGCHPERRAARLPTEVEVLRMYMSKTEERMRRRDLRKIFVDPNAHGVALPAVGFDSENTTRGVFSAQDDTKGGHLFKQFDKSKFERPKAKFKQ